MTTLRDQIRAHLEAHRADIVRAGPLALELQHNTRPVAAELARLCEAEPEFLARRRVMVPDDQRTKGDQPEQWGYAAPEAWPAEDAAPAPSAAPLDRSQHAIPLPQLHPSPTNPRKTFDAEWMAELADNIREHGVLQPILVRPWPDEYPKPGPDVVYEIVAGESRYRAATSAGLDEMPALIRALTTAQVLEMQIIENLKRRGLHELEEADGYAVMIREHGYTPAQLAEKIGQSKAYIYGRLKLTSLQGEARDLCRSGELVASCALLVARLGPGVQAEAAKWIIQYKMSARDAQQYISRQYMKDLRGAVWPLDTCNWTNRADCKSCPQRTGNQPELYTDSAPNVCTSPDCYEAKCRDWGAHLASEAQTKGLRVISGDEAAKIAPYGVGSGSMNKDFVALDARCYDAKLRQDGGYPTYREILEQSAAGTTPVMIEDVNTGALFEAIERRVFKGAAEAAGIKIDDPSAEMGKEREAKAKAEGKFRRALWAEIHEQLDVDTLAPATWTLIAGRFFDAIGFDAGKRIAQFWAEDAHGDAPKTEPHELVNALRDRIGRMDPDELTWLILDCALAPMMSVSSWEDPKTPDALLDLARGCGIQPQEIRAALTSAAYSKAKKTALGCVLDRRRRHAGRAQCPGRWRGENPRGEPR